MSRSLLAHVVSRFAPRQWENVATESLLYLLGKPGAEQAITQLVAPAGFTLPRGLTWSTRAADVKDDAIPDLVGKDDQGRQALIIESKFWAGLTPNQPLTYLARPHNRARPAAVSRSTSS